MTSGNGPQSPYAAVLADLRAKRDEIDNTIRVLEQMSGLTRAPANDGTAQFVPPNAGEHPENNTAGMFLGMSIVDAAKKLLGLRMRAMSNSEILAELQKGGLVLTGADPLNVVGSVMTRRFNQVGDVVRVARGTWGLKEWYPNRTFKTVGRTTPLIGAGKSGMDSDGEPDRSDDEDSPMQPIPDSFDSLHPDSADESAT